MSKAKGPYASVYDRPTGRWNVIGPSKAVVDWFHSDQSVLSDNMARACNIAHHHAIAAQAERVRQLEEANKAYAAELLFIRDRFGATEEEGCLMWMNCDNETLAEHGELSDASDVFLKALTPPAKGVAS